MPIYAFDVSERVVSERPHPIHPYLRVRHSLREDLKNSSHHEIRLLPGLQARRLSVLNFKTKTDCTAGSKHDLPNLGVPKEGSLQTMLIDDFPGEKLFSTPLGSKRRGVSDRVMGGISIAGVTRDVEDGQTCLRLAGDVRKENGGGSIQALLSFSTDREHLDAADFAGIRLSVCGNGECIPVHIRTPDCGRPWQSY